jgi:hypothetical protein
MDGRAPRRRLAATGTGMLKVLEDWLADGEGVEGDWARLLLRRASEGALARVGPLLVDLPALAQSFTCRSSECTPGRRAPRTRSCCADVEVTLGARERGAIERALPSAAAFLGRRDPRWRSGPPPVFDGDALRRPNGRCVFAIEEARGLRCALHLLEVRRRLRSGALKPIPCRLFPLALVDLGDGRRLLTAVHRATASDLGTLPAARFPCLRGDPSRPPLYRAMRETLHALFGRAAYRAIARAMRRWRG